MINKKIHFIGINGSGASGAAIAAKKYGFDVSGCDININTPYAAQVLAAEIPVFVGHDVAHITDMDIIAASPAVKNAETTAAGNKLISWQGFIGKYILPNKRVIAVAGTHGKTTTSAMMAHIMIDAGLDPSCFIGALIPEWNSSNRIGSSDWVIIEADEYANNFSAYHPEFIILNNLEMEHPEYFHDFEHYKQIFRDFLANAKPGGALIYNADDENVLSVISAFLGEKIPFSSHDYNMPHVGIIGAHNIMNARGVITMANKIGIKNPDLQNFHGTSHRLEKIFSSKPITIYDDYAHHHKQMAVTIAAVRAEHPDAFLIVAYEPHQISRWEQNTTETLMALNMSDMAVVLEFWRGRESHLSIPDIEKQIHESGMPHIRYIPNFSNAATAIIDMARKYPETVILILGAGKSWELAKTIKESFE